MAKQSFKPTKLDLGKAVADAKRSRVGFSQVWDALEEEYTTLHVLLNARKRAGLTQEDVAERMGTTKSAISRLENSLREGKHSPSVATLKKYARACGKKLVVGFAEMEKISPETFPDYHGGSACKEIDDAYEALEVAQEAKEFYAAISILVFHARHLTPRQHANLAEIVKAPFKRTLGKPKNLELYRSALRIAEIKTTKLFKSDSDKRTLEISRLAKEHSVSTQIAGRALRQAESEIKSKKIGKK